MPLRIPLAAYRVQFNPNFSFHDATLLIKYFKDLGISDLYSSPIMQARTGSLHGYDITDYSQINTELGGAEGFEKLAEAVKQQGMGIILDIVPNHMCINDPANQWWWDVLENGRNSPFGDYFDIDWEPPKPELVDKILLPFLDEQFGMVIENQQIRIELHNGSFILNCPHCVLPVNPKSWNLILIPVVNNLEKVLDVQDSHFVELKSIVYEIEHLPGTHETEPKLIEERQIEKEIIKKRLHKLLQRSKAINNEINQELAKINDGGDNFALLEEILTQQAYRLSYWRVANEEINYRRFFDINDLAGIRTENPEVFSKVHEVVIKLVSKGWITGLRIDHVDGLWDPEQYFVDLQKALGKNRKSEKGKSGKDFYILIEKVLTKDEKLLPQWLVHGTSGYDFLNLLNGIFVETHHRETIYDFYRRFTEYFEKINKTIFEAKKFILYAAMPAELHVLARHLDRISEQHRWSRDYTRETLLAALRNVIASFPVYRSYVRAEAGIMHGTDKDYIHTAIRAAKKFNPAISSTVFDFVQSVLLLEYPPGLSEEQIKTRNDFVMHFQQQTGPVMAKGVEDTAFYRTFPLLSINEVGGDPTRFGVSLEKFHSENQYRQEHWPHTFSTTSTHDTKRSEDVRARINVISEIPDLWRDAVLRWNLLNKSAKSVIEEEPIPGNLEEYLIYQTLIGTWPLEMEKMPFDQKMLENYTDRIVLNLCKAMKEAKVNTSWINPNEAYDQAIENFIRRILDPKVSQKFLKDFLDFTSKIIRCGMYNSLSQVLLKAACPGVPEYYQGCELWNYSMVDPDNRMPIDFILRQKLMEEVIKEENDPLALIKQALDQLNDGKIKMFITRQSLKFRNENMDLFTQGTYTPLETYGDKSHHIAAFARNFQKECAIAVAGRFFAALEDEAHKPLGKEAWGNTLLNIPNGNYVDVFTKVKVSVTGERLMAAELFTFLPFALLKKI